MGFTSILFHHSSTAFSNREPSFFRDLHLHDIMERILTLSEQKVDILSYFYTLPDNIEDVYYRQEIYTDLMNPSIREWITNLCRKMEFALGRQDMVKQTKDTLVQAAYYLEASMEYGKGIEEFVTSSMEKEIQSEGLQNFYAYVSEEWKSLQQNEFCKTLEEARSILTSLTYTLSVQPDKIVMEENAEEEEDYLAELKELLQLEEDYDTKISGVFSDMVEPSVFERTMLHVLNRNHPDTFERLVYFYKKYKGIFSDVIFRFTKEVHFYLSFLLLAERTKEKGYPFCMPQVTDYNSENTSDRKEKFIGEDIYDVALLWKSNKADAPVVTNDFSFYHQASFFVVTGPNQGGKTTFARALGQAVYFSIMGLPVNASFMEIPFFRGLSTHFETEESLMSNAGKLKEEINRLEPMMLSKDEGQFIILNELFTTATTADAYSMGKRVMEHFLERKCYGIYVTHIQELAEESDFVKSLVAQVEEGEEKKRTYRIIPMKPQGYGYSESLVIEFHLQYEEIVRRLS